MARVEKTIEVDVPVRVAYNQWTQFESFPEFMDGVQEVRQLDDRRLHWKAKVGGKQEQWDAIIREQVPDQKIIWMATNGAENAGMVTFDNLGQAKTRVHLEMSYDPEGFVENVGDSLGFMSRRVEGDLKRFKDFIESRSQATGAWRGTIDNPNVPGGHTTGDTSAQPSNKGGGQHANREGSGSSGRAHQNSGSDSFEATGGGNVPGGTSMPTSGRMGSAREDRAEGGAFSAGGGGGATMRSSSLGNQQDDMSRASYGPESAPLGMGENPPHPDRPVGGTESVIPDQNRGMAPGERATDVVDRDQHAERGDSQDMDRGTGSRGPSNIH